MTKKLIQMAAVAAIVLATGGIAQAVMINAGPISGQDAGRVCPQVCSRAGLPWNRYWTPTQDGSSACACGDTKAMKQNTEGW